MPPLVALLARDKDGKTRGNAAGALGNLVRKSDRLASAVVCAGALQVPATLHSVSGRAPLPPALPPGSGAYVQPDHLVPHQSCGLTGVSAGLQ